MDRATVTACPTPVGAGFFVPAHMNASAPARRHLTGLEGMPRETLMHLLDAAKLYRERIASGPWQSEALRGVAVCNAFFEDSTRTRVSFELAEQRLGAMPVTIAETGTSLAKGESVLDTLHVIASMHVTAIVVRHRASGMARFLAGEIPASIINAGDGQHEHPTQGLLDLMTLRDAWGGRFERRRIAIVGDIRHSRVARSAIAGLRTLGARVTVCGPATLLPAHVEALGCEVAPTTEDALSGADAAMALRLQRERMEGGLLPAGGEYAQVWGLTPDRLRLMADHAVVLHPGPVNRGVEITPEAADGPRSAILRQTANGIAVRCAVLSWCVTGDAGAAA